MTDSFSDQLFKNQNLKTVYEFALTCSTDQLIERFQNLQYKCYGFGGWMSFQEMDSRLFTCCLRNNYEMDVPDFKAIEFREALAMLYAWCLIKGYLKII